MRTDTLFPYTALFRPAGTASIGAIQARGACSFQQLYSHADAALYAAKQGGRDRVVVQDIDAAGDAPTFTTDRIVAQLASRSEERRVGQACFSNCSTRGSPYH